MKLKLVVVDLELTRRQKRLGALGLAAAAALSATAAFAVPVQFAPNTALKAADLNANFEDVDDRLAALTASSALPSAVMAFDSATCPTGWIDYAPAAGRTIIGVNPTAANGISVRALGSTTGAETHAMTVQQMPSHNHAIALHAQGTGPNVGFWTYNWNAGIVGSGADNQPLIGMGYQNFMSVGNNGGGQAFNIMQPSLALRYCKKN